MPFVFAAVCRTARFSQDYSCLTFVFLFTLTGSPKSKRRNLTGRQSSSSSSSKPRRRKKVFCQKQKSVKSAQNRSWSPRENSRPPWINREQRKDKPERRTTRKQSGNKQQAKRAKPRRGRSSRTASQQKRAKQRLTVIQSRRKRNPNRRK